MMSAAVLQRVRAAYLARKPPGLPDDYNPVEKVPVHIFQVENQLLFEELMPDDAGVVGGGHGVVRNDEHLRQMQVQLNRMDQRQQEQFQIIQAQISTMQEYNARQFKIVNNNMTRYYMAPVRPVHRPRAQNPQQAQAPAAGAVPMAPLAPQAQPVLPAPHGIDPTARLSKAPKELLTLWHEYLYGLNGNKPAKDFTYTERGRCKYTYSRRKCFWDVMVLHIRAGLTELVAIDRIKAALGVSLSCTKILKELQRHKTHPHPNLVL